MQQERRRSPNAHLSPRSTNTIRHACSARVLSAKLTHATGQARAIVQPDLLPFRFKDLADEAGPISSFRTVVCRAFYGILTLSKLPWPDFFSRLQGLSRPQWSGRSQRKLYLGFKRKELELPITSVKKMLSRPFMVSCRGPAKRVAN